MNKFSRQVSFCTDLLDVFSNYADKLDQYFKIEKNRQEHIELFDFYKKLNNDLIEIKGKYSK